MKNISLYLTLLISACILPGCSEPPLEEVKPPVTMAQAGAYEALADNMLGVNENGKGLTPGSKIGAVSLSTITGKPYELATAWGDKPALIIFYRGGWCAYCNAQVRELSQNYEKIAAAGVQPVLISVDAPDRAAMMDNTYDIPFPVLSDTELLAHFAFNVAWELDDATLMKFQNYGIVPSDWSSAKHNTIAIASAFIVDQQGIVRFSHAPADYRTRPSTQQLLAMVKLLNF